MTYPSHIKKQLQDWATTAYRRELARELQALQKDIDLWQRERISSEELTHRIHAWDTGPSQALVKQYDYGQPEANVAFAVVAGILKEKDLPDELLDALTSQLEMYRELQAKGKLQARKGTWWR